jgi:copper chaperone NosL
MALAAFLPLWRIEIFAPQYPEGLFLEISVNQMSGNIDQINILNHYIGMKPIVVSEIPELKIAPIALMAILALGLVAVFFHRRWLSRSWFFLVSSGAFLGIVDMYLWGYDYGHNLHPDAPIKIPGMSYQPPLIGHKTLLNIDSYSLPDWGGYLLAFSLALGFVAAFDDKIARVLGNKFSRARASLREPRARRAIFLALLSFTFVQCTTKAEPLVAGEDHCDHCRMQVSDVRFGGEAITKKGRIRKFDSVHCLLAYYKQERNEVKEVYLSDFLRPGHLIRAEEALFLRTEGVNDPMGPGIAVSGDREGLQKLRVTKGGEWLDWNGMTSSSR